MEALIAAGLFGYLIFSLALGPPALMLAWHEKRELEDECVKRGFAEWKVGRKNEFTWK